jgi:hypothetical protein
MLSVGASRLASKATESALKFGEIASQKVVQVTETVGEKVSWLILYFFLHVLVPFCFIWFLFLSHFFLHGYNLISIGLKVKEGRLLDDVASSVSSVASKVKLWAFFFCHYESTVCHTVFYSDLIENG